MNEKALRQYDKRSATENESTIPMRRRREKRARDSAHAATLGPGARVPPTAEREEVRITRDQGSRDATLFWKKPGKLHPAWSWASVGILLVLSLAAALAIGFGSVFLYYVTR